MTESAFKRLTPENQCQIREIQEASRQINRDPHNRDRPKLSEERTAIITDALSITQATDFSSALNGYYAMFKKWGLIDKPQCRAQ